MSRDYSKSYYSTDTKIDEDQRSLQREIRLARNIQMQLLNSCNLEIDNGRLTGSSIPARLIGGDYYDFYKLPNGKIRIVIGDVMGKGIPAAMLMILTRGAFRSAAESTSGPGETLTAMNNAIYEDLKKLRSFVTIFCCDWDAEENTLTYANAGHVLPLHVQNGRVNPIESVEGVMLGGLPDQIYPEKSFKIEHSDVLFFYTDGIIEAQNEHGEFYKLDRLKETLLNNYHSSADELEEAVVDHIFGFTKNQPQKDDITMVILQNDAENASLKGFNSPMNT
ncbi:PP2C family protein-serine/threonine phosphatase [Alkalibacillus aidingensis]|uniref:PP2C family protein-serine/threonine phosphatase n=1 Tax=Alkalibacillus aidingensis TaxID=2747607 RepID=UPI002948C3E4|nr:PP2C family protein-serine/threonine phosphatase [Alkalibacillus aidingensis]